MLIFTVIGILMDHTSGLFPFRYYRVPASIWLMGL